MVDTLDENNVFDYLAKLDYCKLADRNNSEIDFIPAKNFNLAIAFADGRNLLVKQEVYNANGDTAGEFWSAWSIQQLVETFPELGLEIGKFLPELLHFDVDRSILIVNFLADYRDLSSYYDTTQQFPVEISSTIGRILAIVHSHTFGKHEYRDFLTTYQHGKSAPSAIDIIRRLSRITPRVFQKMPIECLQFYKLYQRFPSLSQAIAELGESIEPSCLVHNDLKLNNLLLADHWQSTEFSVIRVIDWERADWGDPAFDLGCLLGSYLEIWLDGLVVSNTLSINESLQLAATPLELLQPSLLALVRAYVEGAPEILAARPETIDRAIQFAGLALIQRVEITIDEERIFGNRGIVMLQVAKQLICTPQAAMPTLFGTTAIFN
jgi:thiamine kinase-like enzyme